MKKVIFLIAAALAPVTASAMPTAPKAALAQTGDAAGLEQIHAVRVCNRGRCWWTHGGHHHGGHGWGHRPGYGWGHPGYGHGPHHGHGWGHPHHRHW